MPLYYVILCNVPSGYLLHSHGKSPFLIGKPSINGPFPIATLNNQRVVGNKKNMIPRISYVSMSKVPARPGALFSIPRWDA
jgi:hypothetical protein